MISDIVRKSDLCLQTGNPAIIPAFASRLTNVVWLLQLAKERKEMVNLINNSAKTSRIGMVCSLLYQQGSPLVWDSKLRLPSTQPSGSSVSRVLPQYRFREVVYCFPFR
jgi:hypothetical protein